MSAALEQVARAIHADIMENAERDVRGIALRWEQLSPKTRDDYRKTACAALRTFLDFVENSQQPISHDAMQTLRKHLEPKQ